VARLAEIQQRLLDDLARRVEPGGLLVYAVCTLTPEEGPELVRQFLRSHGEFVLEPAPPQPGCDLEPFHQRETGYFVALPQRHDTDGFFAARLRRPHAV
jgi:16S rRNA (cytosine967-C5)-methyltransferase